MAKSPTWLLEHRADVHSQTGEDGVVAKILELLPERDRWCVEFGAWDGRHLSNTANLIEHSGYAAVLIEADPRKFKELAAAFPGNPNVVAVNQVVGSRDGDNLDTILRRTKIPADFDFLSVDIDGNDYHVWKAVTQCRPKVVCIEFNPTIPTDVVYVQRERGPQCGSSLAALTALGKEKGYELVSVLPCNAFFVRAEYFPRFEIVDNRPQALRTFTDAVTYLFSAYDGTVLLAGAKKLPWHDVDLDEKRFQVLPRVLRSYALDYSFFQRQLFRVFRALRRNKA